MQTGSSVEWGAALTLLGFYAAMIAAAVLASRRRGKGSGELMLAGRALPLWLAAATMAATWVGGGYINGSAESTYSSGLIWVQAPWGYALSLVVGGVVYAPVMRRHGFTTMLDPLQQRFGNRHGALLYGPALLGEVFWSAAILTALGSTFSVLFGIEFAPAIVASAAVAIGYTLIGGLWAVAVTDVLQLGILVVGLAIAAPLVTSPSGGIAATWSAYIDTAGTTARWLPPLDGWAHPDWGWRYWNWWDSALLLIFGGIPWHVYFQRVLAARDAASARTLSLLAAPICLLAAAPAILIGATARVTDWAALGLAQPEAAQVLPWVLRHLGGPVVASIGLAAVAAAVMSSVDSSILSAASMGAWNVYRPLINPGASDAALGRAVRIGILAVGAASLMLALRVQSVYALWFLCSDLVYCILFPQLTAALFDRRATRTGAAVALVLTATLRLGAGEPLLGLPRWLPYPMLDASTGAVLFPFRTFIVLCGMLTLYVVSRLPLPGAPARQLGGSGPV